MGEAAYNEKIIKPSFEVTNLKKRLYELLKKDERLSQSGSFGFVVLCCTAQGQYDRAITELDMVHIGLEEYKDFESRARRFINHAKSLVQAIKIKYEICTSEHVSKTKQKELANTIIEHFMELRKSIVTIEKIQKSVRSSDMKSTIFFTKILFFCIILIFSVYVGFHASRDLQDVTKDKMFHWIQWSIPE